MHLLHVFSDEEVELPHEERNEFRTLSGQGSSINLGNSAEERLKLEEKGMRLRAIW